jgi:WD40 repeat protein
MRFPRYTIRSLLVVVLFVAFAVAALRAANDAWDGSLFALTSLILLTATLLAVHRTHQRRAFWLGFALFGWAYLIASLIPPIGSRLPTTKWLAFIDSKIPGRETTISAVWAYTSTAGTTPVQTVAFSPQGNTIASSSQGGIRVWDVTTGKLLAGPNGSTENFIRIGHSLFALVLAFVGGYLSRNLYGKEQSSSAQPVSTSPV